MAESPTAEKHYGRGQHPNSKANINGLAMWVKNEMHCRHRYTRTRTSIAEVLVCTSCGVTHVLAPAASGGRRDG